MKALATKIRQSQERELKELEQFGTATGTSGREDAHDAQMMQQSKKAVERVQNASGSDVDRAFLEEMAKHHQMATQMSGTMKVQNPGLKQLVTKMVAGQKKELAELQAKQRQTK